MLPAVGDANVLRFIPPLIMETSDIDRAMAAIDAVLARLERGDSALAGVRHYRSSPNGLRIRWP